MHCPTAASGCRSGMPCFFLRLNLVHLTASLPRSPLAAQPLQLKLDNLLACVSHAWYDYGTVARHLTTPCCPAVAILFSLLMLNAKLHPPAKATTEQGR